MTSREPHVRTELGAYVLGALEPADRHTVELHLTDCGTCRDELSRLSVLPGLLDRLTPDEALVDLEVVRRTLPDTLALATRTTEQRLRRQLRSWRAMAVTGAATAAAAIVFAWAPWQPPPDRVVVALVPIASAADATQGTVAAYAWEWGTTVEIRVESLPPAEAYAIWTVRSDGHRERAGTWGPTELGSAYVRGASAILRDELARVEVTDPSGVPLFAASFTADG